MAKRGARKVIGLDIQDSLLAEARRTAATEEVTNICFFSKETDALADVIISIDTFEHFDNPPLILSTMRKLLSSSGCVIIAFGPTWYHPFGGHLFSVFPWAHLIFTENALLRWRSDFKTDGAKSFSEVQGGLNQMTIRRFIRIIDNSPFKFDYFEAVPIRKLEKISNKITREFTTSYVRCKLIPK